MACPQLETAKTVGSIDTTDADKRMYAAASMKYNVQDRVFCTLFPELVEMYSTSLAEAASNGGAGGPVTAGSDPPTDAAATPETPQPKRPEPSYSWSTLIIALCVVYYVYQAVFGPKTE